MTTAQAGAPQGVRTAVLRARLQSLCTKLSTEIPANGQKSSEINDLRKISSFFLMGSGLWMQKIRQNTCLTRNPLRTYAHQEGRQKPLTPAVTALQNAWENECKLLFYIAMHARKKCRRRSILRSKSPAMLLKPDNSHKVIHRKSKNGGIS